MRLVDTPLPHPMPVIEPPRSGAAIDPSLAPALLAGAGAEANRTRLLEGAAAVTTGQQPGLFGGPLYTIYKALSAAALAARLEAEWNRPVVPVFWLAGDDHDFVEASTATWQSLEGALQTGALATRPADAPSLPMYRLPLGEEVTDLLRRFEQAHSVGGFLQPTMAWLRRHYRPGATVAAAYAGALTELLGAHGIVCFTPTHPAARTAMTPWLEAALRQAGPLDRDLAALQAELADQGRPVNMATGDGGSLVFYEGALGRDRLMIEANGFLTRRSGERLPLADLAGRLRDEPQKFSPNVLLRPVVERALLPTVGYVAGPGELAYLPLAAPVYQRLGVPAQQPVPRWSGLVVEARVDRVLAKFGADLDELLTPEEALERRVVRSRLPAEAVHVLEAVRTVLEEEYPRLIELGAEIDPTIRRPITSAQARSLAALDKVQKKMEGALGRREAVELGQIGRVRAAVQPGGKPQERVFGVATFLARFGPDFLDQVAGRIGEWYQSALVGAGAPS